MFHLNRSIMKRFLIVFGFLFLIMGIVAAQDPTPPDDLVEWVGRFPEMIGSFWGLVVSAILLVPVLLGFLNLTEIKKSYKYLFTAGIVMVLTLLASVLEIGYLHGAKLWFILVNGIFVLGAQVVGYAALKPLLDKIAEKFNPWKNSG